MPIYGINKRISLNDEEIKFVNENFYKLTNTELAKSLGIKLTTFRMIAYRDLGLKRIEMEYWNDEMISFLKKNYKNIGDVEISEIFQLQFPKNKPWTKKHIEKKRRYLGLKRTKEELSNIIKRNFKQGRFNTARKTWRKRPVKEMFTIVKWKLANGNSCFFIKTESGYSHYLRWLWEKEKGAIPKGYNVVNNNYKKDVLPTINDLECISDRELALRNKTKFNILPKDLQDVIILKNKIQKTIKNERRS